MSRRVAIVQSSYIPWKGYFDLINTVDEFVLFDDVQYTRRDWRNRNRIKTPRGPQWLTIPVKVAGKYLQKIRDTEIESADWPRRHWTAITQSYQEAAGFRELRPFFEALYLETSETHLSAVNERFLTAICAQLGIRTRITRSMDYEVVDGRIERLLHLCRQTGASTYVSGPSARAYVDAAAFERAGIGLEFMDYTAYPEYPQIHGAFDHQVSIVDLMLNTGQAAARYLKTLAARVPRTR